MGERRDVRGEGESRQAGQSRLFDGDVRAQGPDLRRVGDATSTRGRLRRGDRASRSAGGRLGGRRRHRVVHRKLSAGDLDRGRRGRRISITGRASRPDRVDHHRPAQPGQRRQREQVHRCLRCEVDAREAVDLSRRRSGAVAGAGPRQARPQVPRYRAGGSCCTRERRVRLGVLQHVLQLAQQPALPRSPAVDG